LENKKCIQSGKDIIKHNAEAAVNVFVKPVDRKWFEDIKESE